MPPCLCELKFSVQPPQQPVFRALHFAPQSRFQIIVAQQMQNAVDNVTHHFRLPACAKFLRLRNRVIHANEQLAVKGFPLSAFRFPLFRMVKRDDVRRAFVPEKLPVHPRHFLGADKSDAQFRFGNFQLLEQRGYDFFQQPRVDFPVRWRLAMKMVEGLKG